MKVMMADSLGMCFGVRDAVAMALSSPHRSDLTILGELVHNTEILRRLREAGIQSVPSIDTPVETSRVMITAHGAATGVVERLRARGLRVEEATCPLVAHAHRQLQRLVAQGYFPVVIGHPHHVEVRGLVGDLDEYAVISSEEEVPRLAGRPRLGVVSQTTQPVEFVRRIVDRFRAAFPDVHYTVEDQIAEGDKVVVRYRFRGTHLGAFQGMPPTGKQVTYTGILIYRIVDGKIAEQWTEFDLLGFLRQLGVLPNS